MAKRIYVGRLPYSATGEQLTELFSPYGSVSDAVIITDRMTGRSKGFAFVEMPNDEEAANAITALNGTSFGGFNLVVNEARAREERTGGSRWSDQNRGGGSGGGGGRGRDGFSRKDRHF